MKIVSKMEQEVEKWRSPVEEKEERYNKLEERHSKLKAGWRLKAVKTEISILHTEKGQLTQRLREITEMLKGLGVLELELEKLFAPVRVVERGKLEIQLTDEEILEAIEELRRG